MVEGAFSAAPIAESSVPDAPVPQMERANILLVDDHPENLLALEAVLEPLDENLFRANSGFDALRLLLQHEFAVILMDAQMPEMNGFETAALIRAREKTRNVPIIFVTAHSRDHQQLVESYYVGAVDYIPKPFAPDILRSKIRVFVDLFKKNEQLRRQETIDAERRQREHAEQFEKEHMRKLTQELETRVVERTAELIAANEELESFCYSISHDLRAPLRVISATSKMLLQDAGSKLADQEKAQLVRQADAASRLGELIDDLLSLARLTQREVKHEDFDISDVASKVGRDLQSIERRHEIIIQPGLTCHGDVSLVRVLLQNLLENACKYSPNGGEIRFGKERDAFFVRDQGIGVDMKYAHKIFLPFERLVLEREFPGTGIGLATAQRVVARHGGNIWVESAEGKGSTFFFTLSPDHPRENPNSGSNGSTKTMHRSDRVS
jgi:two-component system sensor histidine kinase/response regulator